MDLEAGPVGHARAGVYNRGQHFLYGTVRRYGTVPSQISFALLTGLVARANCEPSDLVTFRQRASDLRVR